MNRIDELFNNMDKWRHLPSYQLERRADIFFSLYLHSLLENRFGVEIDSIIPEFPIRIGTIDPKKETNQSFKVDYLAKLKGENQVIFVELKTDAGSRRTKQDRYLERAKEVGLVELLRGLNEIYTATTAKKKYQCLFEQLQKLDLITVDDKGKIDINKVEYSIDIVYLQPNNIVGQKDVITFHEAAEIIEQIDDGISTRFAQSLREWANVNVGDC